MKGSTLFWLAITISAVLFGEYQLYIHRDTWVTNNGHGVSAFFLVNVILLIIWEVIFGIGRANLDNDGYDFKKEGFTPRAVSPLFLIYIFIKYYLNPFLDKLLY